MTSEEDSITRGPQSFGPDGTPIVTAATATRGAVCPMTTLVNDPSSAPDHGMTSAFGCENHSHAHKRRAVWAPHRVHGSTPRHTIQRDVPVVETGKGREVRGDSLALHECPSMETDVWVFEGDISLRIVELM